MVERYRVKWAKEETILAFDLFLPGIEFIKYHNDVVFQR